jgi:RNA polymerase sigma factor (sigma-70 family)
MAGVMPILAGEARKLAAGNSFTVDDLIQEGALAVISAMETYDPGRGNLRGYIRACARNRMISYLRRNGREAPVEDEALGERIRMETADGSEAAGPLGAMERREAMIALIGELSPFEVGTLNAYLRSGSVSGAAEILGCDRKRADNALQRIRRKARNMSE